VDRVRPRPGHTEATGGADRRDRRKDRLLQENGYLVLRFLAEDVGASC
jgi:very-short-patch-repair endonuclease